MRRRLVGQVLVVVGVALLLMAPVVRWLVPGWAVREPDQVNQQLFVQGTGSFIDQATQQVHTGVPLQVSRYITTACTNGDPTQSKSTATCPEGQVGSGDTAVWDQRVEFTGLLQGKRIVVSVYLDVVAFDRSTGAAVPGYGQPHDHKGAQVFFFPFHTEKRTYQVWDVADNHVEPATFVRETTYAGQPVYEFDQNPQRDLGSLSPSGTVPGALLGRPSEPSVAAHQIYTNHRKIFVEPRTGTILGETDNVAVRGRALDGRGTPFPIYVSADLETTPASQAFLVARARDARNQLRILETVVPVALLFLGALALLAGVFLRGREPRPPIHPVWRSSAAPAAGWPAT